MVVRLSILDSTAKTRRGDAESAGFYITTQQSLCVFCVSAVKRAFCNGLILKTLGLALAVTLIVGAIVGPAWAYKRPVDRCLDRPDNERATLALEVAQAGSAANNSHWRLLTDRDYQFTLEYPSTWHPQITIDVPRSASKAEWILRRYSFIGGGLDIDIWASHNRDLSAWLEWMGRITDQILVSKPNSVIAGYAAVAFVEGHMLSVFVDNGQYVYRFWLTLSTKDNLEGFVRVLNTFRLSETRTLGVYIPGSILEKARESLNSRHYCPENFPDSGRSRLDSLQQGCDALYNQGCCGLASTYCSTYFPCSRDVSNNQHRGNCTWHVCYQYGAVPFRGNAGTWWNQVPNYANWSRGYNPQRGENIAWWGGSPGHVAYVGNYQGGNQVVVSEMSWCESCGRTRTIAVTNPGGYIWRTGPQPTAGNE